MNDSYDKYDTLPRHSRMTDIYRLKGRFGMKVISWWCPCPHCDGRHKPWSCRKSWKKYRKTQYKIK